MIHTNTHSSENILASTYDDASKLLTIEFRHENARYVYSQVQPDIYKDFVAARSPGKFFHLYIKPQHQGVRIA